MKRRIPFGYIENIKSDSSILDKLVSEALMKQVKTHAIVYGYPEGDSENIFMELVKSGYYNGKTCTFKTPMGTITFHAEVHPPREEDSEHN